MLSRRRMIGAAGVGLGIAASQASAQTYQTLEQRMTPEQMRKLTDSTQTQTHTPSTTGCIQFNESTGMAGGPCTLVESRHKVNMEELAVCKRRGHVARTGELKSEIMQMYIPSARPATKYESETATEWQTCYYCGTEYRFVTKIEER